MWLLGKGDKLLPQQFKRNFRSTPMSRKSILAITAVAALSSSCLASGAALADHHDGRLLPGNSGAATAIHSAAKPSNQPKGADRVILGDRVPQRRNDPSTLPIKPTGGGKGTIVLGPNRIDPNTPVKINNGTASKVLGGDSTCPNLPHLRCHRPLPDGSASTTPTPPPANPTPTPPPANPTPSRPPVVCIKAPCIPPQAPPPTPKTTDHDPCHGPLLIGCLPNHRPDVRPVPRPFPVPFPVVDRPHYPRPYPYPYPNGQGPTVDPVMPAPPVNMGTTTPSPAPQPAPTCLTKTYLDAGRVMFRDVCSQEWAINTTSVTVQVAAKAACLAKENPQNGVVLFRDLCTNEWAMNPPPGNQAQTTGQAQPN